jgi:hypothetical protein
MIPRRAILGIKSFWFAKSRETAVARQRKRMENHAHDKFHE